MDSLTAAVQNVIAWALPIIFAITLHEVAHGWAARALGDSTAKMLGRLSLNPLKHVDPIGTVALPAFMLLIGGFVFGWAKPVPVDLRNLRNPRLDMALVALAGPLANLAMALGWGVLFKYAVAVGAEQGLWYGLQLMARAGLIINISLLALNLLPLPPLDGSRVLMGLLPERAAWNYARLEPYGFYILLGLVAVPGLLGSLLYWPRLVSYTVIGRLLGMELV
ncbi:MAG TPA: site-2 protease family protein [Nevskia sp.]|nr:site-2 protease family protein [Nevskia sp.]